MNKHRGSGLKESASAGASLISNKTCDKLKKCNKV